MAQKTTLAPYGTPGPHNIFQSKWGPVVTPIYCDALNLPIYAPELVISLEPFKVLDMGDDLATNLFEPELVIDLEPELTVVCP